MHELTPLIFDIDGTLWNACAPTAKGWSKALQSLNIDQVITPEQNASVAGNPNEVCIEMLMPGLREKYPALEQALEEYEIEAIKAEGGTFYEGVIDGIRQLAKTHQIFLVSNCQDWYIEKFLEHSGLRDVVRDYDCYGMSGKPKGVMLANLKAKYQLTEAVYIGDTTVDQKGAHEAGMEFIRAGWGFGDSEGFEPGTRSFEKFEEIVTESGKTKK